MTVAELIEQLKLMPPDAKVCLIAEGLDLATEVRLYDGRVTIS